ncbi:MAG TPA: hypothetical protein VGP03_07605 [Pseudonocardiaceae bacterium]|jgi:hypothetical protein|nr:hypothetical protein [Pseudonocardiaceae bacterium]
MADHPHDSSRRDPDRSRNTRIDVRIDHAAVESVRRFSGAFDYPTVRRVVAESYERLAAGASVHTYLPILAARSARQWLESEHHPDDH